jgi:uncharacterized protein YecE (DUF72 family)
VRLSLLERVEHRTRVLRVTPTSAVSGDRMLQASGLVARSVPAGYSLSLMPRSQLGRVWIGTSGWSYKHWEKSFYPDKQPAREHLAFYAQHFSSVEINYSYYQLPERKIFENWRLTTPETFLFAVKASRYLTHMKKLKDPDEPLQRLLNNAMGLAEKLGPVLFQFPPRWAVDLERLTQFLRALQAYPQYRYAFEFRHQSWLVDDVYVRLRSSNAALCLPIGWRIPLDLQLTADWTYLRFHGGEHGIEFEDEELGPWAERIGRWRDHGVDIYSYFNNDPLWHGRPAAIANAHRLREMIGV